MGNDDMISFYPTEVVAQDNADRSGVRLVFNRAKGSPVGVEFSHSHLRILLALVQSKIGPGPHRSTNVVSIDRCSLQIGTFFDLHGWKTSKLPSGGLRLTLMVNLLDQGRVVEIPINISRDDAASLAQDFLGASASNEF